MKNLKFRTLRTFKDCWVQLTSCVFHMDFIRHRHR